jgi:hypothetical protein
MSARKRGRQEMEAVEESKEPSMLERVRNMWEFANLAQWIFIFGRAVKIDENLDIEVCNSLSLGHLLQSDRLKFWALMIIFQDLEMECLKTNSTVLPEIGLALLKFVSSHRGLTYVCHACLTSTTNHVSPEIFDEYTRRQYVAKAPERNPFGVEEEPAKFAEFDIFTKVGVAYEP